MTYNGWAMKQRDKIPTMMNLDKELKLAFKAWCARHEVYMTDMVEKLMREHLRKSITTTN